MKRKVVVCLALILATGAFVHSEEGKEEGGQDPKALEILEKADAAVKAVTGVRYSAKSTPGGIALNFVSAAEGESVVVGWNNDWRIPQKYFVHLTTTQQGSDEPLELTGGGDGEMFFLIDHNTKKAYEDMDPAVMGSSGNVVGTFGMQEFVHDRPFDDELNAPTLRYEGKETVGGEECHKIFVEYGQGGQSSTWFFSAKDFLPRRRVQHFNFNDTPGTLAIEIANLEIDPEVDEATFRLKLPKDYEQIDDFAP